MEEDEVIDIPLDFKKLALDWAAIRRTMKSIDDLTDEECREFAQLVAEDVFRTDTRK